MIMKFWLLTRNPVKGHSLLHIHPFYIEQCRSSGLMVIVLTQYTKGPRFAINLKIKENLSVCQPTTISD